ncbi:hypothetical protein SAMN04488502_1112 [Dendrosporobacter quercicolus]|uniref:Uncharacterized protein n=1 Tax=Dendrosporobacter quercicolus TaxID=146817 RepID=A0A1G9Y7R5_9FIRM|nr:hypothetical protein SAMN04488502_1112 [Dendrosporobacter quercicolus]
MYCLMYNLKRVLNLLGTEKLIEAIKRIAVLPVARSTAILFIVQFDLI